MLILSFILYNSRGFSPENQYIIRNKSQYFISKSILSVKGSRIYVLFLHWHTHEVGQPFHISLLLLFLAFHLVGLKCQPAAFGQPQRYSPPPLWKKMPWYCVSAELGEDQPDQSGWKWRPCGHLLRGWKGEISSGYSSLGLHRQSGVFIFYNSYESILSAPNFILMMRKLRLHSYLEN